MKIIPLLLLATLSSQSFAESLLISGSIEAKSSQVFTVPASSSWQIKIEWMAEEGTLVNAGDTVIMYDTASLSSDVEQQEAALRKAEAEAKRSALTFELAYREAEFRYDKALLDLKKARLDAEIPEQQLSKLDFAENQLALNKAEIEVKEALKAKETKHLEKVNEAQRHVYMIQGAEKNLQRSQSMLNGMIQKAKQPGTVQYVDHPWLGFKIRAGDTVQRNDTAMKLPFTEQLHVRGWLNEVDIARVNKGQKVAIRIDAIPDFEKTGTITKVSNQAEPRKDWGDSAYFALDIAFDDAVINDLIPGMSVVAEVELSQ